MPPVAEITTDEAPAVFVAVAQAKQAAMNPFERLRAERIEATRPGRRRWAEQITQTVEGETDDLVERHGRQILANAEALLRQADPVALAGQRLHLVDFDTIGTRSVTVSGFTMAAGVFQVLRPSLPADARRQRRGLWADAAPVAPWEWRKTEKDRKTARKAVGLGR
ncbi:MAG: hypothetical protein NT171_17345 [Planctomycetota bacterium]|nr:hypothetical protein [Planctomycetota bacterium]